MKFTYIAPDDTETVFSRDAADYKLLKRYSGLAEIPVMFSTDKSPYQHGETLLDTLMEPRDVSFDILIQITSDPTNDTSVNLQALQALIAELSRALNPLDGPGVLYYERDDGTVYRLNCSGYNTPQLDPSDRSDIHQAATITFRAHDPFWYSGSPHLENFGASITPFFPFNVPWILGNNTNQKSIINAGNVAASVTITFWGPVTNPTLTNATNGKVIALALDLLTGDRFDITTGKNTVTAIYTPAATGIPVNGFPYVTIASKFWLLKKGSNNVIFSCTTSTAGSGASIIWSDQYAGVF